MNSLFLKNHTRNTLIALSLFFNSVICHASLIFINEIHYDNTGADKNEFVELAGTAGLNLLDWSLEFYNGTNGLVYKSIKFSDVTLVDSANGFGFTTLQVNGIQNGGSNGIGDGIAIVDNNDQLIQFLSYEGAFEAKSGAALGLLSQNISISQNSTALGKSLQLTNNGSSYNDFVWSLENTTLSAKNVSQTFINETTLPVVEVSEPRITILFLLFILILFLRRKEVKRVV